MNHSFINLDSLQVVLDEHRDKLNRFSELLIAENQKYNLTRIDSPQRIEVRHFLDSLAGLSVLDTLSQKTGKPLQVLDIVSTLVPERVFRDWYWPLFDPHGISSLWKRLKRKPTFRRWSATHSRLRTQPF
jgi:hypothetical protein